MIKRITDEERQLFRNAVANVKPLKQTLQKEIKTSPPKKPEIPEKKPINPIRIKPRNDFLESPSHFNIHEKQPDIAGTDIISFARAGVQHKRFSQLSRGKIRIEATIDLHEHTSDEAITAIEHFLTRCQQSGFRTACIIHGKGLYSTDNKPVLKNLLNSFLRQHPMVLAFHSEKNNPGAMVVMLKSS